MVAKVGYFHFVSQPIVFFTSITCAPEVFAEVSQSVLVPIETRENMNDMTNEDCTKSLVNCYDCMLHDT